MSANEKPSFAEILAARGADAGLKFTEQQLEQFTKYYELLVETNKVMNLTALTEPEEVAVKHMIDSLLAYDEDMAGKTLAVIHLTFYLAFLNFSRCGYGSRLSRSAAEDLLPGAEGNPYRFLGQTFKILAAGD